MCSTKYMEILILVGTLGQVDRQSPTLKFLFFSNFELYVEFEHKACLLGMGLPGGHLVGASAWVFSGSVGGLLLSESVSPSQNPRQ